MIFKFKHIDEEFGDRQKKMSHYEKHVAPPNMRSTFAKELYPSPNKYEKAADKLANMPCTSSDPTSKDRVIGFVGADGKHYKYDTKYDCIVVYEIDYTQASGNLILTYFPPDDGKGYYLSKYKQYYDHDIPEGE